MLTELKIQNFAIIDKLSVQFQPGFNILSGETGSGKTLMLKSLALLMGGKSTPDIIKTGQTQATVEGAFDLSERPDIIENLHHLGLEADENVLVVRRLVSQNGKSRVYLNGSLATLGQLKDLVCPLIEVTGRSSEGEEPLSPLIEMTSQHENRNLQFKTYHLDLVDHYLGLYSKRLQLTKLVDELSRLISEQQDLQSKAQEKAQRLDFLSYQSKEISTLKLKPGDEDDLKNKADLLRSAEKLGQFAATSESHLYSDDDSVLVRLHRVIQELQTFSGLDTRLKNLSDNLQQAKALIEEATYELRNFSKDLDLDGAELADLEEQLSQLRKLQKKYGPSVAEIFQKQQEITDEMNKLEQSENRLEALETEIKQLENTALKIARSLHDERTKGVKTLISSVQLELEDLNMKGVLFGVQIEKSAHLCPSGITEVEFTIQNTKKDKPRPLAKFASGGELSRILLSLKRVIGLNDRPRTYLFDEVDAGVSGVTAEKVGRKLKSISKGQQVICVTHLPQVAAFADAHFVIHKTQIKDQVQMSVAPLESSSRVEEVARMISGEKITKTSLAHAEQLIDEAHGERPQK